MSQDAQPYTELTGVMKVNESGRVVLVTDKPQPDPLDKEIEIIERTLYNALDRLKKIRASKR